MFRNHCVIIGNGAAGISAAEAIRWADPEAEITVISEEPCLAYSKVLLHHYIGGEIEEEGLYIRTEKFYTDLGIHPLLGVKVKKIFPGDRTILLADESKKKFDELLIATGSFPLKPPIKGVDQAGVHTLWTLNDARKIRSSLKGSREAIVIGGSFVGIQAVDALIEFGLKITVVDIMDRIMPRTLDLESSRMVQKYLEEKGVKFLLGVPPVEIEDFRKTQKTVLLEDGKSLTGDIIIVTAGARPSVGIVDGSPIERNVGILVDEQMRTNYPNIFAAGDVAEGIDALTGTRKISGLWTTAVDQGKIAGLNMTGKNVVYAGAVDMNSVDILGFPVVTIGKTIQGRNDEWREEIFVHPRKRVYRKFLFEKDCFVGAILMGYVEDAGLIGHLVRSRGKSVRGDCYFSYGLSKLREIYLPEASRKVF